MWEWVSWWRDYMDLRCLPFGGLDLMAQPAYVYQVIRTCEQEHKTVIGERQKTEAKRIDREQKRIRAQHARGSRHGS